LFNRFLRIRAQIADETGISRSGSVLRIRSGRDVERQVDAERSEPAEKPGLEQLAADRPLAARLRDHALTGKWADHRDCQVKPDLVLIYRLDGAGTLQRVRLGSHAELGF
jgi:mRNA interferase YafQ